MFALLVLSLALAMDAFAVSLVRGAVGQKRTAHAIELGLAFGLAQGLMPLLGWGLGLVFSDTFERYDHWIAFVLLSVLGARMLLEAGGDDQAHPVGSHGRLLGLMVSAFATSVDAAAAGLTLPLLGSGIPVACLTIGVTTGLLCTAGYLVGSRASAKLGRAAELFGGIVLIVLGIKILTQHLMA
ncbi:manganese efflux pump [Sphingomonas sp. ID1715]|uniref:manganese efflux pump MntP n=1 Tax=Sphingomonas sp. ID1715 TaxID=1656898 RepID=UPI001488302E|nr:manganese efflux pump MntP family protein [Sphingomonas sp. ID1715]NNM78192.1 manganese efflux pump [Sphingomonas sp. ID1715]